MRNGGFVAPCLTRMREDAPQRQHDLQEVFNAVRWIMRTGAPWRMLLTDFPAWEAVYQQTQRWIRAGVFEAMVHDLGTRRPKRLRMGFTWRWSRCPTPSAASCCCRAGGWSNAVSPW
jgi:transposase